MLNREKEQEIIRGLTQFESDFKKLDEIYPSLVAHHLHQWAAVYMGNVLIAPTFKDLAQIAQENNVALNRAAWEYIISSDERNRIIPTPFR